MKGVKSIHVVCVFLTIKRILFTDKIKFDKSKETIT